MVLLFVKYNKGVKQLSKEIKRPFTKLQVGEEYFYCRPDWAREMGSDVIVEEMDGEKRIKFSSSGYPFPIPVDAIFTKSVKH